VAVALSSTVIRSGTDGPGRGGTAAASDEGWRAAGTVLAPASSGVTAAWLPKRTPMANLVPGTAGTGSPAGAQALAAAARSPAETRDCFASFQRGVREGRAAVGQASGGEADQAVGEGDVSG